MTDRINVGVVGTGMIGEVHARNLHRQLKTANLVAVADMDVARARELGAELGGAAAYADGRELIDDPRVEAVVIASPDPTHFAYVIACLRANKPVMCEKPLATTAAEAIEIIEAESRAGGRRVQVGFMREFDAAHIAVRAEVESGRVGEPVMFRGTHTNAGWGRSQPTPDRVIISSLIHDIHSARWLMGQEIASVYVRCIPREAGRDDTCRLLTVSCTFANGALGLIDVNVEAGYGYFVSAQVVGTTGTVTTAQPYRSTLLSELESRQAIAPGFRDRFDEAYLVELEVWVRSLLAGEPVGPSTWDGYAALAVADACRRSVASGQPETVDLVERFGLYA